MGPVRLAGVDVKVHVLTLPLQAALALAVSDGRAADVAYRFALVLLMLAAVLWHELCHAFAARALGIPVFDVRLHALGGLARIQRDWPPAWRPRREALVALAGPAGNLLLGGAVLLGSLALGHAPAPPWAPRRWVQDPVGVVAGANLWMGLLNLVPVFPADGGRVLRSLLAVRLSHLSATRAAFAVGAVLLGVALWLGWRRVPEGREVLLLPPVALLAVYATREWRAAQAFRFSEVFWRFVGEEGHRFPALAALPRDGAAPLPAGPYRDDPEILAAWRAYAERIG